MTIRAGGVAGCPDGAGVEVADAVTAFCVDGDMCAHASDGTPAGGLEVAGRGAGGV